MIKSDKYAAVTERIIDQLEAGCAPWVRPWVTTGASDMPTNIVSERHYRGANVLNLWMTQTACVSDCRMAHLQADSRTRRQRSQR